MGKARRDRTNRLRSATAWPLFIGPDDRTVDSRGSTAPDDQTIDFRSSTVPGDQTNEFRSSTVPAGQTSR